jgi:hypothetical protein
MIASLKIQLISTDIGIIKILLKNVMVVQQHHSTSNIREGWQN